MSENFKTEGKRSGTSEGERGDEGRLLMSREGGIASSFIPVFLASNARGTRADSPAITQNKSAIRRKYDVTAGKNFLFAHCWDSALFPVIAPACNQVERCRFHSTVLKTVGESGGGGVDNQAAFIGA